MGFHDEADVERYLPLVYGRLLNPGQVDFSYADNNSVINEDDITDNALSSSLIASIDSVVRHINQIPFHEFRDIVINHFTTEWNNKTIVWPSRTGVVDY